MGWAAERAADHASEVESLAEPVESADSLGFLGGGVESVVIPVVIPPTRSRRSSAPVIPKATEGAAPATL